MLLAEAVRERADAERRLDELEQRIGANARVYESGPAEDPQALLRQATEVIERISALSLAVEATNAATRLPDGATISAALARRAMLRRRLHLLTGAAARATETKNTYGRHTVTLDVAALHADADRLAEQHRALDAEIQRIGWTTELAVAV
jgi:hypothetical protein